MTIQPPVLRLGNGEYATDYVEDPACPGRLVANNEQQLADEVQAARVELRHLTNACTALALRIARMEFDLRRLPR